jgi:hypothetical protein
MIRRVLSAVFAAVVIAGFAAGFGVTPASADGERTTITPWRGEQHQYRTIEGWNFPANTPVRLFVSSPAGEAFREISSDGMMTGHDGSIWFQILPSGFASGDLQNGVWQLRVCANACHILTMFIGGHAMVIPTGLPARLCTPTITPILNFPTFGPPGNAYHPSGYTYNDIVAYCGPYATPWTTPNTFLVPTNWTPGYLLPTAWPYQTVFPWPAYWYNNVLYNNNFDYMAWCIYQVAC